MHFKPFEPGIEVNGRTIYSVVDALDPFMHIASDILIAVGIGTMTKDGYKIDLDGWYSQEKWLNAFERICEEIGNVKLQLVGSKIPENALFPTLGNNIETGIRSIDIAYHMNHRKNGEIMYNSETGKMLEGIGHYGYEKIPNENKIICKCENPYPHYFDLGLIAAIAKKFEPNVNIVHDDTKECREKGDNSCTYIVTW